MTVSDRWGNPTSSSNPTSVDAFDNAADLLLGFYADPLAVIDEALAADPDFVLGHCFRAGLMALSTEKAAVPELRKEVEAGERLWHLATDRERGHIQAARAWLDGEFTRAVAHFGDVSIEHPRDLLALQLAHQGDFFFGQASLLRDRPSRVLPAWTDDARGRGFVLGMQAFGFEESGEYARGEEAGRHAVELNPRDPWAIHAVAHVMEMQNRLDEGIGWLNGTSADWSAGNMFAFHNWWHLALYHLDRGEIETVVDLYDRCIHPAPTSVALELVDGVALLWRLYLRGIDVGERWRDLADAYEAVAEDAYYSFNDMHGMMAFVASGRDEAAGRLLAALESRAEGTGTNAGLVREIGLPICTAIRAFGAGDHASAARTLLAVRHLAPRFGGSHAQRDVITLTLIEAALRGGEDALARALVAERAAMKPASPLTHALNARLPAAGGGGAVERAA